MKGNGKIKNVLNLKMISQVCLDSRVHIEGGLPRVGSKALLDDENSTWHFNVDFVTLKSMYKTERERCRKLEEALAAANSLNSELLVEKENLSEKYEALIIKLNDMKELERKGEGLAQEKEKKTRELRNISETIKRLKETPKPLQMLLSQPPPPSPVAPKFDFQPGIRRINSSSMLTSSEPRTPFPPLGNANAFPSAPKEIRLVGRPIPKNQPGSKSFLLGGDYS